MITLATFFTEENAFIQWLDLSIVDMYCVCDGELLS